MPPIQLTSNTVNKSKLLEMIDPTVTELTTAVENFTVNSLFETYETLKTIIDSGSYVFDANYMKVIDDMNATFESGKNSPDFTYDDTSFRKHFKFTDNVYHNHSFLLNDCLTKTTPRPVDDEIYNAFLRLFNTKLYNVGLSNQIATLKQENARIANDNLAIESKITIVTPSKIYSVYPDIVCLIGSGSVTQTEIFGGSAPYTIKPITDALHYVSASISASVDMTTKLKRNYVRFEQMVVPVYQGTGYYMFNVVDKNGTSEVVAVKSGGYLPGTIPKSTIVTLLQPQNGLGPLEGITRTNKFKWTLVPDATKYHLQIGLWTNATDDSAYGSFSTSSGYLIFDKKDITADEFTYTLPYKGESQIGGSEVVPYKWRVGYMPPSGSSSGSKEIFTDSYQFGVSIYEPHDVSNLFVGIIDANPNFNIVYNNDVAKYKENTLYIPIERDPNTTNNYSYTITPSSTDEIAYRTYFQNEYVGFAEAGLDVSKWVYGKDMLVVGVRPAIFPSTISNTYDLAITTAKSATQHFTVSIQPKTIPQLVSPTNNAVNVDRTTTFAWQSVGNAKYYLQVSLDQTFASTVIDIKDLDASSYSCLLPTEETKYYWRVGISQANVKTFSDPFSLTTVPIPKPTLVSPINDMEMKPFNVKFVWRMNAIPSSNSIYTLELCDNDSFEKKKYAVTSIEIPCTNTVEASYIYNDTLSNPKRLYWRVWYSDDKNKTVSDTASFMTKAGQLPRTIKPTA